MLIKIEGEDGPLEVTHWREIATWVWEIETDDGDFIVAKDSATAGEEARDYWHTMVYDDREEFVEMVGKDCLVNWCLGVYDGPGTTKVPSLSAWLDIWLGTPEEHFASCDGTERDIDRIGALVRELGFTPTVAYRSN